MTTFYHLDFYKKFNYVLFINDMRLLHERHTSSIIETRVIYFNTINYGFHNKVMRKQTKVLNKNMQVSKN